MRYLFPVHGLICSFEFMLKKYLFVLLFCFGLLRVDGQVLPSFGDSRTGTTGFQFLKIAPDARSASLGESYTATANDPAAMFWNPAGIAKTDSLDWLLTGGHAAYFGGINLQHVALVKKIGYESYLGVGVVYLNSGDMDVTTEFQPFGTGQSFRAINMATGITYAQRLTENFNFGVTAKYILESMADIKVDALVFDFGFQYDVGIANTRFAVGISNFGFNSTPKGEIEVTTLAGTKTVSSFEEIAVPAVFRLGFAWDMIKKSSHLLTMCTQLNHPTDNNETLGLGAEYTWRNILVFRTGYLLGTDEKGLPSFGFGINMKRRFGSIMLDYGFVQKNILGATHRLTLGFGINNQ